MRLPFRFAALLALAALGAATAHAQTPPPAWPTKPIRMIVTFPPGGSTDAVVRILAPKLGERLGQQVIVDNRPGAGGTIGTELAARATADGYTLLMGSVSTISINPSLYKDLQSNPM